MLAHHGLMSPASRAGPCGLPCLAGHRRRSAQLPAVQGLAAGEGGACQACPSAPAELPSKRHPPLRRTHDLATTLPPAEYCCNGTVVEDDELGKVLQLQGDQRKQVSAFLISNELSKKDNVKVHGA